MFLMPTFALLLQALWASRSLASSNEQETDCSAVSMSLLQVQVQLDHIQQLASEGEQQVRDNTTSLVESLDRVIYGSSLPPGHSPYHQTCTNPLSYNVKYTFSKYLSVIGVATISVFIAVCIALWSHKPGGEQQLLGASGDNKLQSVALSPLLVRFIGAAFVMVMINQTIVMPASESKSKGVGQSLAFSGYLIGAYGLGVVMSFPFFLHCSYNSYKLGMVFVGLACFTGNALYAVGKSPATLIVTRIICGLEGGVVFMNQVIVQRLCQGDGVVKATAQVILFPFVGLILGPVLSSMCQNYAPRAPAEVPPSVFMASIGVLFTLAVIVFFPSNQQCYDEAKAAGLQVSHSAPPSTPSGAPDILCTTPSRHTQDQKGKEKEMTRSEESCSLLSIVLLSAVNLSRMVQRLFWETATLHLLMNNYHLGMGRAGSLLTSSLVGLMALPYIVVPLKRKIGIVGGLRCMDIIELVGILIQFRVGHLHHLCAYMLGSTLFYIGNMGQFNFLVPLRQQLAVPYIWSLSIEGGVFIYSLFQSLGTFLGPVAARGIQSECDSQNLIPTFLLVTWFMNFVCKEISVGLLVGKR